MTRSQYKDHVMFTMGDLVYDTTVRGLDVSLGVLLTLCTLVGLPGNVVALSYFTTAIVKKKVHITKFIYIAIASVDICMGKRQHCCLLTLFIL